MGLWEKLAVRKARVALAFPLMPFIFGCAGKTGSDTKIVATLNLGAGFDTSAITGLVLILDAPGDAGLNLSAYSAKEESKGGHTYTSEVKDCDGDGRNEFCVTFLAENPFSGGTYTFTFSGSWAESVLLSLKVIVQLQGGKQETATKEQLDDGTSLRFVAGQTKTVTVSIPCRAGYSCTGTIDTTPPAAPVGTGVTPQGPANNNAPVVTGTAEADTTIRIFAQGTDCTVTPTSGTVNDAGQFSVAVPVADNTTTVFYGRVVDLSGNVGNCVALNAAIPYIEDSTAPATPNAPDLSSASDMGASSTDNITNNTTPTLTGTVEGFAMVSLYHDGGTLVGTASTSANGAYSVTSSALGAGAYAFTVKATDDAGNVSDASAALSVTIDTTPPATPAAPDLDPASDTGASSTDNITLDTTPTFSGTVEANATVTLYHSGTTLVGTATANGAGSYSVTSSVLPYGPYTFTVTATDIAGNVSASSPGLSVSISDWMSVVVGGYFGFATKEDGTIWGWGSNNAGQLGDGTTTTRTVATNIYPGGTWAGFGGGEFHTCGRKIDGTLWCWGENQWGQLGDGTTTRRDVPTYVDAGTNWTSVGGGYGHTCGRKGDGTIWCWGVNSAGRLGDGTTEDRLVPTLVDAGTNWMSVDVGVHHACATKGDGTLWCWGSNTDGQLGDGTTDNRSVPTYVDAGTGWASAHGARNSTCARKLDGTIWCWGSNSYGQLGDGTDAGSRLVPTLVNAGANWTSVAAGDYHVCAINDGGALWCWGGNGSGQLGDGTTVNRNVLTFIDAGGTWTSVSLGDDHTCGTKADRTLWCWGRNNESQLGDGTTTQRTSPTPVSQ